MAQGPIAGRILGASLMIAWLAAACTSDNIGPIAPAAGGGAPPSAGTCTPNQATACVGVTCAPGVTPVSTCSPTGTPGACACPGAGGAGTTGAAGTAPVVVAGTSGATPPVAGTGSPVPVGGGAPVAGAAGGGTVGGTGGSGSSETPAGNLWAMMGYDTKNNYFNPLETKLSVANAPMLKEKWRFTVSGYPPGTPIIAEGKVFVMSTGASYALNLADGKQIWMRMDIAGTASAAYDKGFVYLHSATGDLYKVNAADGKTVWGPVASNDNKGCADGTSSPILGNGKLFVGHSCGIVEISGGDYASAKGGVEAFDAETGVRAWTYFTAEGMEDGAMVWSTVSVDLAANVVFAGTGNNYTVLGANSDSTHAIDIATGKVKWKKQVHTDDRWSLLMYPGGPDSDFGANPVLFELAGKKVVANGDKGGSYHMWDRETGEIIWQRTKLSSSANQANGGVLMNGAFDGKYLYAVSNQPPNAAQLHAMDPANQGMDVWPAKMFTATTWGAPSLANGVLVVPNDDKLYVLNAMTGAQLAMFMTGGTIAAGAASIVDGNIVVQSGLQYALDSAAKNNNLVICYSVP